ncbi:unnamed protein product [Mesocestoides corti]|uniref:Secreted protein n=1 Tax=Mesocestoides corti TaxID=53468 RepID=A0A0R3URI5_MESCO|nr:unnamed protein product [Mesocestoides corti]
MVYPSYLLLCLAVCDFSRAAINTNTGNSADETTITTASRVIQGVTSSIQRCLSGRVCLPTLKSFHVIGKNSVNWQGRILSATPSSPYYSCELRTSSIALGLSECTARCYRCRHLESVEKDILWHAGLAIWCRRSFSPSELIAMGSWRSAGIGDNSLLCRRFADLYLASKRSCGRKTSCDLCRND